MSGSAPGFPIDVTVVRKSARESLSIRLCEYEGHVFVDVRTVDIASGSQPQMTKRGVTINPRKLGDLIAALQDAERQAAALGLLADGGGR